MIPRRVSILIQPLPTATAEYSALSYPILASVSALLLRVEVFFHFELQPILLPSVKVVGLSVLSDQVLASNTALHPPISPFFLYALSKH